MSGSVLRWVGIATVLAAFLLGGCAGIDHEAKGDAHFQQEEWDAAVQSYSLALTDSPTPELREKRDLAIEAAAKHHFREGQRQLMNEQFAPAIAAFVRVLELQPEHAAATAALVEAKEGKKKSEYQALVAQSADLRQRRELGLAQAALRSAVDLYSRNSDARESLRAVESAITESDAAADAGDQYLAGRDWGAAATEFQRALDIWVSNPRAVAGAGTAKAWLEYEQHLLRARRCASEGELLEAFEQAEAAKALQDTRDVRDLLDDLGRQLYAPAFEIAQEAISAAERGVASATERLELLERALGLLEQAQRYQKTSEVVTRIEEVRSELSRDAYGRGVRAAQVRDYEAAVQFLEVAQRHGQSVGNALVEARHGERFWRGLAAEAAGRRSEALQAYREAAAVLRSQQAQVAVARVSRPPADVQPISLAISKETGQSYAAVRESVIQRLAAVGLRAGAASETVRVIGASFPRLGAGLDVVSGKLRPAVVTGESESRAETLETVRIRERSDSASFLSGDKVDFDLGLRLPQYLSDGALGYGEGASKGAMTNTYSLELTYEITTRVESLSNPSVTLQGQTSIAEWVDAFGTHFVDEIQHGGSVTVVIHRIVADASESAQLKQSMGIHFGPLSLGSTEFRELQRAARSQRLHMSATIRGGGISGRVVPLQDLGDVMTLVNQLKADLAAGGNTAALRIRSRSFGDPGIAGFPFERESFRTAVARLRAGKTAEHVYELIMQRGQADLSAQRRREREAREAEQTRRKEVANKVAAAFSFDAAVYQSKWIQVSVVGDGMPSAIELSKLEASTGSKVQVFLLPASIHEQLGAEGVSTKTDARYNLAWLDALKQQALYYFDSRVADAGTQNLQKWIPAGEYYYLIYNFNELLAANVSVRATIRAAWK